ncbi:MAG TPA: hypothetical protein V6D23_18420, partial [Candidatus Obscuribacterales bacterium]
MSKAPFMLCILAGADSDATRRTLDNARERVAGIRLLTLARAPEDLPEGTELLTGKWNQSVAELWEQ